jgi:hypothetical protein
LIRKKALKEKKYFSYPKYFDKITSSGQTTHCALLS